MTTATQLDWSFDKAAKLHLATFGAAGRNHGFSVTNVDGLFELTSAWFQFDTQVMHTEDVTYHATCRAAKAAALVQLDTWLDQLVPA